MSRTASITKPVVSTGSGTPSFSTSPGPRTGGSRVGGPPSKARVCPMASQGTRMSEKRIAASTPSRSTGWRVTSAASSGVLHTSRKLARARTARYSGRNRPAWRIIHTGVKSVGRPKQARRKAWEGSMRGCRTGRP